MTSESPRGTAQRANKSRNSTALVLNTYTMVSEVQVISFLGGPGSGKGTLCALLQETFLCAHFSVGDVLRAEATKPNSPYTSIIEENIRLGRVGPKEITVGVLQSHMKEACEADIHTVFLDGRSCCDCQQ